MNPSPSILQRQMPGAILPTQNNNNNTAAACVVGEAGGPGTSGRDQPPSPPAQATATLANASKEKTPMCLVNELARHNKMQHQYRLMEEAGPPHKKTFTVLLKIDAEEYTASGPSIKKAQHSAAAIALERTSLKHPPPKSQRKTLGPITPTVELNALAMKRGEPAVYQLIEPQRPQYIPNLNFRGMYHQRYHYPKVPTYYVSLKVGNRQFFGEGRTAQAARHNAAEEALAALRTIPYPEAVKRHLEAAKPNGECGSSADAEEDDDDDLKSPISLVHEIALKRGLTVGFEVTRESGPPHMRSFLTRCTVGEVATEGEGNGKKVSKKRAAEKMLDELRKLPSAPLAQQQKIKKKPVIKKKSRNLIKVVSEEQKAEFGGVNPISRLIQIQQAKKEREPVYSVLDERGEPRQREFIMQCSLGEVTTNGVGPNKKTAKRNAAEAMLQQLGYSRPAAVSPQGIIKADSETPRLYQNENEKKSYVDIPADKLDNDGKLGRQLVPGLLLMPDASLSNDNTQSYPMGGTALHGPPQRSMHPMAKVIHTLSLIAKELIEKGMSSTAEAIRQASKKPMGHQPIGGYKQKLLYLAEVLSFPVHFTDFPKGAKMEHICLVSVSISPPLVKHGSGATLEMAHDQAALGALRCLAELESNLNTPAGDGLYMNAGQGPAPKMANATGADLGGNPQNSMPITARDSH